jgi:hypothetical protein
MPDSAFGASLGRGNSETKPVRLCMHVQERRHQCSNGANPHENEKGGPRAWEQPLRARADPIRESDRATTNTNERAAERELIVSRFQGCLRKRGAHHTEMGSARVTWASQCLTQNRENRRLPSGHESRPATAPSSRTENESKRALPTHVHDFRRTGKPIFNIQNDQSSARASRGSGVIAQTLSMEYYPPFFPKPSPHAGN